MTDTTKLTDTIHIPEQPTPSSLRCRHIVDGRRCGSPSMRGERFCYHHHETRRPVAALRQRRARQATISLPAPESRPQIQQAIGDIMLRLGNNDIDPRRAGLLLYALQLATSNLNEHQRQNARAAAQQDDPAEPHPQSSTSEETPAPTEEPRDPSQSIPEASLANEKCHPDQSLPEASNLPLKKSCHPERTILENPDPVASEKGHPERTILEDRAVVARERCHPERSAAESKDLRSPTSEPPAPTHEHIHYGSGPAPDLENPQTKRAPSIDFTPPPPVWHRLSPAVGRTLLETLGRHHAGEFPQERP